MRLIGAEQISQDKQVELVAKFNRKELNNAQVIRELFAGGLDVRMISNLTKIGYNQCYNVVKNEVLKHGLEVETSTRGSKSSKKGQILELLQQGKSLTEVAQITRSLYNYVWMIANTAGLTKKALQEAEEMQRLEAQIKAESGTK